MPVSESARINARNTREETPLQLASRFGHVEATTELLKAGADFNAQNNRGNTALHLACYGAYVEVAKRLCDAGADSNIKNEKGNRPIHLSRFSGDWVLSGNVNQVIYLQRNLYKFIQMIQLLQKYHADLNSQNFKGKTFLHLFLSSKCANKHNIQGTILERLSLDRFNLQAKDHKGETVLHYACRSACFYDDTRVLEFLLEKGADCNAPDYAGNTALHQVCAVNTVMGGGYDGDGGGINTNLTKGMERRQIAVVKLLLNAGSKVSAQNDNGNTPLHVACKKSSCDGELVRTLIKACQSRDEINIKNHSGRTPLHVSCMRAEIGIITSLELILDPNSINILDANEKSPLFYLIRSVIRTDGYVDSLLAQMIVSLMLAGADKLIEENVEQKAQLFAMACNPKLKALLLMDPKDEDVADLTKSYPEYAAATRQEWYPNRADLMAAPEIEPEAKEADTPAPQFFCNLL